MKTRGFALFFIAVFFLNPAHAAVIGKHGAVSSGSLLASQAGVDIMRQGGNAADAAVATAFALAVTHPSAGNLGGGTFILYQDKQGKAYALDAREVAPLAATQSMFQDEKGNVIKGLSTDTHLASGVPGTVDGLLKFHETFGRLSRKAVLAPAIQLAEKGFVVDQALAQELKQQQQKFQISKASLEVFTQNGSTHPQGFLWKQKDLAKTLKRISHSGRAGFYEGRTAELIVAEMQRGNGVISLEDLKNYQSVWREPVKGKFHDAEIISMPPSSSGGVLIVQMLNMLEPWDLQALGWHSADYIHLLVEAQRRAFADRAVHLGDTDFYEVPLNKLMSKDYAKQRFKDFRMNKAGDSSTMAAGIWPKEGRDTTHFSVADAEGNVVSVTTTLNFSYGNKRVVRGAGFLLNNEMDDFSAKPGAANAYGLLGNEANAIAPGKRMLSSMSPTIVNKNGKPLLITGSPGGSTIITSTLQVILNVLAFDMSLDEAVSAPRFHHQWQPDNVQYEAYGISPDSLKLLRQKGHHNFVVSDYPLGATNSILSSEQGWQAVNDTRRRSGAAAY